MRQRAFPKMLPYFIVGVVYWSVPGCGLPFLWRVFFPDMNIKIENAWIWFAFFYPIFHAWLAENKVSESHSLDHVEVHTWAPTCSQLKSTAALLLFSFILHLGILPFVFSFSSWNWFGVSSNYFQIPSKMALYPFLVQIFQGGYKESHPAFCFLNVCFF